MPPQRMDFHRCYAPPVLPWVPLAPPVLRVMPITPLLQQEQPDAAGNDAGAT